MDHYEIVGEILKFLESNEMKVQFTKVIEE